MFYGFKDQDGVFEEFKCTPSERHEVQVLCAQYDDPYGYSGRASVLFMKEGNLYEVYGSHCSCHGLEDQWEPELVDLVELRQRAQRILNGKEEEGYADEDYRAYWSEVLHYLTVYDPNYQWRPPSA